MRRGRGVWRGYSGGLSKGGKAVISLVERKFQTVLLSLVAPPTGGASLFKRIDIRVALQALAQRETPFFYSTVEHTTSREFCNPQSSVFCHGQFSKQHAIPGYSRLAPIRPEHCGLSVSLSTPGGETLKQWPETRARSLNRTQDSRTISFLTMSMRSFRVTAPRWSSSANGALFRVIWCSSGAIPTTDKGILRVIWELDSASST